MNQRARRNNNYNNNVIRGAEDALRSVFLILHSELLGERESMVTFVAALRSIVEHPSRSTLPETVKAAEGLLDQIFRQRIVDEDEL